MSKFSSTLLVMGPTKGNGLNWCFMYSFRYVAKDRCHEEEDEFASRLSQATLMTLWDWLDSWVDTAMVPTEKPMAHLPSSLFSRTRSEAHWCLGCSQPKIWFPFLIIGRKSQGCNWHYTYHTRYVKSAFT